MRQFAINRNRSAIRIVKRSKSYNGGDNKTIATVQPSKYWSYQSNESRTLNKAINRKPRR